ncbi:MAG: TIGR01777 family oxidoreductase [Phycisphaerae bacterium]
MSDTHIQTIAVTGASGLIGSHLCAALRTAGHHVLRFVRGDAAGDDEIAWNPLTGRIDVARLDGADAIVNLAGESVAGGRWTTQRKAAIRDSRIRGTSLLCESITRLRKRPRVLLSASAVGYFGPRGDDALTEDAPPGGDFLARVCSEWEQAAAAAEQAGVRVVCPRIGVVLSRRGGALAKMLPAFRLGLGGVIGDGRQVLSWITLTDLVRVIEFALVNDDLRGSLNAVAGATTNREFTHSLGRALGRPTLLPLPSWVVGLVFGEMGRAVLLEGQRVVPAKLRSAGFEFLHGDLDSAFREALRE